MKNKQTQSKLETTAGMEYIGKDKETGYQMYKDKDFQYWYEVQPDKKLFKLKGMALLERTGSDEV